MTKYERDRRDRAGVAIWIRNWEHENAATIRREKVQDENDEQLMRLLEVKRKAMER